jgi:hypothetical protein
VVASDEFRYVLLCRHARHDDGHLLPVKDDNEHLRFPTESVARALSEELVIGGEGLRLAKVAYAPSPEARSTANLFLQRLQGKPSAANTSAPVQPELAPKSGEIRLAAPLWLPEDDKEQYVEAGACGYGIPYEQWEELLPNRLDQTSMGAVKRIDDEVAGFVDGRNALLVVGHQPQMGWLSSYLSAGSGLGLRAKAVPLAASEVVCLRLRETGDGWRGRLRWTLAPDDREALDAVSDKVKGKMESAKLLSAVITLGLTALLGVLLDTARWKGLGAPRASLAGLSYSGQAAIQIAFVLLLAALALYLLTMYSYDRLLMPTRFWAEGPDRTRKAAPTPDASQRSSVPVRWIQRLIQRRTEGAWLPRRPPSSSAWVVFRNMQRTWFWLFTPANILVGLALAILAAALLRLHGWIWVPLVLFALAVAIWAWWFRPVLGSED